MMHNKLKLNEIVDMLDEVDDIRTAYLKMDTNEIVMLNMDYLAIAEDLEEEIDYKEFCDWEIELIDDAKSLLADDDNYIKLPDKFDINEYSIMERFAYSYDDDEISDKLLHEINGRGAFRRFSDIISMMGIRQEWFSFKQKHLEKVAKEWCELNKIDILI
jgi:hypothetical protein